MPRIAGRPPDWSIERARENVQRAIRPDASLEDIIRGHMEVESLDDLGEPHGLSASQAVELKRRRNDLIHIARTGGANRAKPPPSYLYRLASWLRRPRAGHERRGALAAGWLDLVSHALPPDVRDEHLGDALETLDRMRGAGTGQFAVVREVACWTGGMLCAAVVSAIRRVSSWARRSG